MSLTVPSMWSSAKFLKSMSWIKLMDTIASGYLSSTILLSSLRAPNASGPTSSKRFSVSCLQRLHPMPLPVRLLSFYISLTCCVQSLHICFLNTTTTKPCLGALQPVEEIEGDQLVYDAVTSGWDFGFYMNLRASSSSITLT